MTQTKQSAGTSEEHIKPLYVPGRWMNLLQRLARFEAGKAYTIVVMPQAAGKEPVWFVQGESKVENQR